MKCGLVSGSQAIRLDEKRKAPLPFSKMRDTTDNGVCYRAKAFVEVSVQMTGDEVETLVGVRKRGREI